MVDYFILLEEVKVEIISLEEFSNILVPITNLIDMPNDNIVNIIFFIFQQLTCLKTSISYVSTVCLNN